MDDKYSIIAGHFLNFNEKLIIDSGLLSEERVRQLQQVPREWVIIGFRTKIENLRTQIKTLLNLYELNLENMMQDLRILFGSNDFYTNQFDKHHAILLLNQIYQKKSPKKMAIFDGIGGESQVNKIRDLLRQARERQQLQIKQEQIQKQQEQIQQKQQELIKQQQQQQQQQLSQRIQPQLPQRIQPQLPQRIQPQRIQPQLPQRIRIQPQLPKQLPQSRPLPQQGQQPQPQRIQSVVKKQNDPNQFDIGFRPNLIMESNPQQRISQDRPGMTSIGSFSSRN